MRYLFFWLIFPHFVFCQTSSFIISDNLLDKGILLDKGWKWHSGDDQTWSLSDFNDADWTSVDPTNDIVDSFPHLLKEGISWLRIHISLDSNVLEHPLAMIIQESVASEFYLNGRLIHQFGIISQDANKIKAYDPLWLPVTLPLSKDLHQVLAIRLVTKPNIKYTKIFETYNPLVSVSIYKTERAIRFYNSIRVITERFFYFIMAISVVLFIFHISFFLGYPARKQSLYFSLFAIIYLIGDIAQINFFILENDISLKFGLGNLAFILFTGAEYFTLLAVYTLFERKKDWIFWVVTIFYFPSILLNTSVYGIGWQLGGANFELLVHFAVIRAAVLASIGKKPNAWIIAAGAIASMVFFAFFLAKGTFYNSNFVYSLTYLRCFYYILFIMSIPIATSIYMGLDYAIVNNSLKQKLNEVQDLSKKSLAQEQEKQIILANQNENLEKQVGERTHELSQTLKDLQSTQAQLIQSEKMASLGELTAGIAHEIQNPLNFVNNFSEVNTELIEELKEDRRKQIGDRNDKLQDDLIENIKENELKINHHGKRADAIVKGMLQHSRTSTGLKEPTDINALCDEYLRLSYHGLRAKDKSFNATMHTDFDQTIGKIKLIPQDIGRVLLNLYNNAFWACAERERNEKESRISDNPSSMPPFSPQITVSTKKADGKVLISVKDNGYGIPQNIKDKIFQPFFTTKPTGQGTGLGLSLVYDIIKAHGGLIDIISAEGGGAEFVIKLPII